MAELPPQQLEHGGGALSVDVCVFVSSPQFPFILTTDQLEEFDVTVEGLVLVFPQFLDY